MGGAQTVLANRFRWKRSPHAADGQAIRGTPECPENHWPQWHHSDVTNVTTPTRFVAAASLAHQALFRHQGRVAFLFEKWPHTLVEY